MLEQEIIRMIKEEALENHVPIIQDESLELLLTILDIAKPNKILEIGTAVGYSAICFSKYLSGKEAKIKTIEKNEEMYQKAIQNIQKLHLEDKIEVIHDDATVYLEGLKEDNTYDVIFIDAAKGQYLKFLKEAIRLAKVGGIIIADNVLFKGRVLSDYNEHKHRTATNRLRTYLKMIEEDERLHSTLVKIGDGIAISIVQNK